MVTMAQRHYRARPWSETLLEEMNLDTAFAIYQERFADAGDFTFVFVGNFSLEAMRPLVKTYLGGLSSLGRNESWRDMGIEPPKGVVRKTVRKGIEPKSRVRLIFTGPYIWTEQNNYDINSMVSVMRIKLREVLREDLSGTYGVRIWASRSHYPREKYAIHIDFGCAPERVEELTNTVFVQIDSVQSFGPDSTYVLKVQESQRRQYETNLKENDFWLGSLFSARIHGHDPLHIFDYERLVEGLSVESIQRAAQDYFNTGNYVRVVLVPE